MLVWANFIVSPGARHFISHTRRAILWIFQLVVLWNLSFEFVPAWILVARLGQSWGWKQCQGENRADQTPAQAKD